MRRGLPLLLVVIVVIGTATSAQAIVNGQPDGNGHPYVGMVFQTGSEAACSGTLVSPTVFVTAGHCMDNFIVNGSGAADVQVGFHPDERDYDAQVSGTPHVYPGWCSNQLNYHGCPPHGFPLVNFEHGDVGVVVLDHAVVMSRYGQLPQPGVVDTLPQKTRVTNIGFGHEAAPNNDGDYGTRTVAAGETFSGGPLADEFLKSTGNPSKDLGGICRGDDGGPELLEGTDVVLATHSFNYSSEYGSCNGLGYSFRLDQPAVLAWIRSWITN